MDVLFWDTPAGKAPVIEFIADRLSPDAQHHVRTVLERMTLLSFTDFIVSKHVRPIRGIYEIKIPFHGLQYRIFFVIRKNAYILLHMYLKKSQKAPAHEIAIALLRAQKI